MQQRGRGTDRNAVWAFTEEFPQESDDLRAARRAAQSLGADAVSAQVASLLTVLAATKNAQNVLEIGTGAGVSTVALLEGMQPGTAMTTVDIDASRIQRARTIIMDSRLGKNHRVRTITGDAQQVLPRLSTGSYDLALVDVSSSVTELTVYQALALLKAGGLLVVHNALNAGSVANPAARDETTAAHRRMINDIADCTDDVYVSLLHAESGVYLVYKR